MKSKKEHFPVKYEEILNVFNLAPDGLFIQVNDKIKYINDACLQMFKADTAEQLIGKNIWDLYPSEDHGQIRTHLQQLSQTKDSIPFSKLRVNTLMDNTLTVEAAYILTRYDNEPALFVIMRDISVQIFSEKIFNMQYTISSHLLIDNHLESALTSVLKKISNTIESDSSRIWVLNKKTKVLSCIASWIKPYLLGDNTTNPEIQIENPDLVSHIFQTGKIEWDDSEKYHTTIALPIPSGESILGVMEIRIKQHAPRDNFVLGALVQASNQVGSYLKRKTYEKELIYLSYHDTVTGLINRSLFEQTLINEIQLATNNEQNFALILIIINDFHLIYTKHGHTAGDLLLRTIAQRLLSLGFALDHTAKIKNNQFAIILHDIPDRHYVKDTISKINQVLLEKFNLSEELINISTNIGVAIFPEDGTSLTDLMRSADIALMIAKQTGSGMYQFSSIELNDDTWQKICMENDIRNALSNEEFYLVYQPIIDTKDMSVVGFEALLRWRRDGISIPAETFVPLIEKLGLFIRIGEWIIRTACEQCKKWQKNVSRPIYVSINISQIEFQNPNLISLLKKGLADNGLNPSSIILELTESTMIKVKDLGTNIANRIKDLGIKISIDDFGSGYSSLNYLTHLPMDYVKLDILFAKEIINNPKITAVVKAAIDLGSTLNYQTIAEGIETKQQFDLFTRLGCTYLQGYYFSHPLSAEDAIGYLKK